MKVLAVALAVLCVSCRQPQIESIKVERWRVDSIWKKPIVGIHDEINPNSYLAKLSNGDTVPVTQSCKVGDTLEYRFIKFKKTAK